MSIMVTALPVHQCFSKTATHQEEPVPAHESKVAVPPFMARALHDFELADVFAARPLQEQHESIRWLMSTNDEDLRRERMAQILDELDRRQVLAPGALTA